MEVFFQYFTREGQGPPCVDIDKVDNVYVAGLNSGNVFQISQNGPVLQIITEVLLSMLVRIRNFYIKEIFSAGSDISKLIDRSTQSATLQKLKKPHAEDQTLHKSNGKVESRIRYYRHHGNKLRDEPQTSVYWMIVLTSAVFTHFLPLILSLLTLQRFIM
ncbi:hypothetical protein CHS0354_036265 [Potamilus streckersoni]|uniref:Uncharacterized protein n=1 Tax=Potamilus streckersoni TaxID=2493646 RepID=A0AAE0W1U2_9BIVA|nr:hypothetical protein CHS0354_036265 [Potamilus streckersoni]